MLKPLSIYVHIPFCVKKCDYCDFLSFQATDGDYDKYVSSLCDEIRTKASAFCGHTVSTVFFGGGTPTALKTEQLNKLLRTIKENYSFEKDAELTVEANPGTLSESGVLELRRAGFNRMSIGLQAEDNRLLRAIGRIHNREQFEQVFRAAVRADFRVSVDLMFGLPGQAVSDWENTLNYILDKQPGHISAYGLIIEEDTPFGRLYNENRLAVPDDDTQLLMYHNAIKTLTQAGYTHYEISNFAKSGEACRHNIVYWRGFEYVGFGLGAHSYIGSLRFRNESRSLGKYLKAAESLIFERFDEEKIDRTDAISEFMFLGLRMRIGVSVNEFEERFGESMYEVFGNEIASLIKKGLLEQNNGRLFLTQKGIDISNIVFAEFILDKINVK